MLGGEGRCCSLLHPPNSLALLHWLALCDTAVQDGVGGDTSAGFLSSHQVDHRLFEITPEGVEALNI